MNDYSISTEDLNLLLKSGKIDSSSIRLMVEKMRRENALAQHDSKIWQGKNGYWYTYKTDSEGNRKLVKKKEFKTLIDSIVQQVEENNRRPTIAELYEEWVTDRATRGSIKRATHDRYNWCFDKFFGDIRDKRLNELEESDYQRFLEECVAKFKLTAKGYNNVKILLRGILKLAYRKHYIKFSIDSMINSADVSERQFRKTVHEDDEEVFNEEEMTNVIGYLKDNPDIVNYCLLLIFVTGIRIGEAVVLRPENIEDNIVKVRATETRYQIGKGKLTYAVDDFPKTAAGVRDVVVPKEYDWLLEYLRQYSKGKEFVFMNRNKRISNMTVRKRLYNICDHFGYKRKSPHKIRKTYATILLDNGVDAEFIRNQLGHASLVTTEQHYHRNRHSIDEKEKVLSGIKDFM